MNKKKLISVIEKYYLGGLCEQVRFKIKNNQLQINAAASLKDCIIDISTPWERDDTELGIYNTTELYKLLKATNDPIQIEVTGKDGKAQKLEISDNQFDLSYNLADLGLISEGKLSNSMPEPGIILNLDSDFVSKFKSAHVALDKVEVFSIQPKVDKQKIKSLEFVIGLQERYANKITFYQPVDTYNEIPKFVYKVSNFKEILNNAGGSIKVFVYPIGIMKLETLEDDIKAHYYIVPIK